MIEQLLNVLIVIGIDGGVRVCVAGEELLDAQRVGRMIGSDQHDIRKSAADQTDAPQQKCPDEDLAQLGVGLNYVEQPVAVELEELAVLADAQRNEGRSSGED